MKRLFLIPILLLGILSVQGQIRKNALRLPTVPGYLLLKCDLHMHTVFSDGNVWPTVRVEEAFAEGLDAIAITDHVENQHKLNGAGFKDFSLNASYDLAKKVARNHDIILIRGCEISKDMPAGHYNALFVKDNDPFLKYMVKENPNDPKMIREALQEARAQGGIVLWNHPWGGREKNIPVWEPLQEEMYKKGLFQGISVANGGRFDPMVLQWCLDKGMTVYSNTDSHDPICLPQGEYRNQTIVFAKERSADGIKKALENRMSVAYSQGNLFGSEELLKMIVDNSISWSIIPAGIHRGFLNLKNNSGIRYQIRLSKTGGVKASFDSMADRTFTMEPFTEYCIELDASGLSKEDKKAVRKNIPEAEAAKEKKKAAQNSENAEYKLVFTLQNLYTGQDSFYKLTIPVIL